MGTHSVYRDSRTAARIFWTYWTAGTVSSVGSAVTSVALPLVALFALHASAFEVGLLTAASWVAWLLIGLPSGVVVGMLPLRETQVAMDLLRALALLSIPVAWWLDGLTMAQLLISALVIGFANVLFDVGNMTLLPAIVPKEELNRRNSLMSATHAVTQLGGPALGGVLVQLAGSVPAVLADAASYVVSAVLIGRLPHREVPRPAERAPVRTMIAEGWRFVARHPVMGPCTWAATAVNFACGALLALAPVYLVRDLQAPAGLVGVLIAGEGVGSLLGATLAPALTRVLGSARALLVAGVAGASFALLMPAGYGATGMALFAVGNAGFAAGVVVFSINTRTYRQVESPPELLARVMATVRFVSWGAIPVGSLVSGAAASWFGAREALWLTAAAAFVPVLVLLLSPVRRLRDLSPRVPAGADAAAPS
jgi:MFS family permease